jgi:hypothetical protein
MEKEKLDPHQSLQIIENMIHRAKNSFSENGHLYLLWGWVILACSLLHFVALKFQLWQSPEMIWMLTWAALIYQIIYIARQAKKQVVNSYAGDMLKAIWLVFIGCGLIMGFVTSRNGNWEMMYPLILMLYGMPTILSGIVLRFRPLVAGGLICWALSIAGGFIPLLYNLLLVAVAVVAAWIIPGYLLRSKYKFENS